MLLGGENMKYVIIYAISDVHLFAIAILILLTFNCYKEINTHIVQ